MKKIAIEEHVAEGQFDQIEQRLKDMDESGIDMQVLNFILPLDERVSAPDATRKARTANEALARVVEKYPERFASFASIALQDPEAAAKELERAVKQLGLKGTMLFLPINDFLDSQKYWVIFETAEKLDVPIYIHPGPPSRHVVNAYANYPILTAAMWGYAVEAGLQAMRLIVSGLFDKYPGLKIILGHMGESIPFWLWRIDNRWRNVGIGVTTPDPVVEKLRKKPSQYFKENFYVTTSGMFWEPALQFVCQVLGADRVLFAVDYPPESNKTAVQFIESANISNSDKEKVCHLNSEKLFRL